MDANRLNAWAPLLYDADAAMRRMAVDELVRRRSRLDRSGLTYLLSIALDDPDPATSSAARRGLRLLRVGAERRMASFVSQKTTQALMAALYEGVDVADLRSAAGSSLRETVAALHALVAKATAPEAAGGAAELLGRLGLDESLEVLYKGAGRSVTTVPALRAIANYGDDEVLFILRKFLGSAETPEARAAVVEALAAVDRTEVFDLVAAEAGHGAMEVRRAVARGLGRRREAAAEARLVAMLHDEEPLVVLDAVDALALRGGSRAREALEGLLDPTNSAEVRRRALRAVGYLGAVESAPCVTRLLRDPDVSVVAAAAAALGELDLPRAERLAAMMPLLTHLDAAVRSRAALAVAEVDDARALATVRAMLESPVPAMRSRGAEVAAELARPDSVRWLVTLVNTELDGAVLDAALGALAVIDDADARSGIVRLLKHANPAVRCQAVRAYSRTSDPRVLRTLEAVLTFEKDDRVRRAAVAGMGLASDAGALQALTRVLGDKSPSVVAAAVVALDQLGSVEALTALGGLLGHPSADVRAAAVAASWKLGAVDAGDGLAELLARRSDEAREAVFRALRGMADCIHPALLAERPMLLAALRDEFRRAGPAESISVTEVAHDWHELFREDEEKKEEKREEEKKEEKKEEGKSATSRTTSQATKDECHRATLLGRYLTARRQGDDDAAVDALDELLTVAPDDALGLYLALRHGRCDASAAGQTERLRGLWRNERFLPGLSALIHRSRRLNDDATFLAEYLTAFEALHELVGDALTWGRQALEAGDPAAARRVTAFLAERMPLSSRVHGAVAELAFRLGEPSAALDHALRAYVQDETDHEAGLLACSLAVRTGRADLAGRLADLVASARDVPPETAEKARRLGKLVREGPTAPETLRRS